MVVGGKDKQKGWGKEYFTQSTELALHYNLISYVTNGDDSSGLL